MSDPITKILEAMQKYGEQKKRLRQMAENSSKQMQVQAIMQEDYDHDESLDDSSESKKGRRIAVFGVFFFFFLPSRVSADDNVMMI